MAIICFELTMPNRGSWNGAWSGENKGHFIIHQFTKQQLSKIPHIIGAWDYSWNDGWVARIESYTVDSKTAQRLKRRNAGFCGYDWMVASIIKNNKIIYPEREDAT